MDRTISYGFYAGGKDAGVGALGAGWKLGTPIYALGDGGCLCDDSKGFGRALSGALRSKIPRSIRSSFSVNHALPCF